MSNPLFQQMTGGAPQTGLQGFLQRFNQFRQMFHGDPQQQIQQLLNSGRVNQSQYNAAFQTAQQIQRIMRGS